MTRFTFSLTALPVAFVFASAALAGSPETVAAEPAVQAVAPAAVSPFDGFWAGLSLGKGYSSIGVNAALSATDGPDILSLAYPDSGASGAAIGLEAGYGRSFGKGWQWGAQIDHMVTDLDANANIALSVVDPTNPDNHLETDFGYKVGIKSMTSVLGRVGYQVNETTMVYGLGGFTAARATGELEGINPTNAKRDFVLGAATVGLGLETLIAQGTSIKVEYRSTSFGSYELANISSANPDVPVNFRAAVASHADSIRLVLVHRF